MSDTLPAPTPTPPAAAGTESEAQRRRRLRQERILNRGSDRLSRIKGTFSQVQEEAGKNEQEPHQLDMVGGHEIKTSEAMPKDAATPQKVHTEGISLESLSEAANSNRDSASNTSDGSASNATAGAAFGTPLRRRAGNLARKARLEAEAEAEAESLPSLATSRGAAVDARSAKSNRIREAASTSSAAAEFSAADLSDSTAGLQSQVSTARRFSALGLSQAAVRLAPVVGVYLFGLMREARYGRFVGERADETRLKWAGLLKEKQDARMGVWSDSNYLVWYLLMLEVLIYSAYVVLGGSRRPPMPRGQLASLLAYVPGVPAWSLAAVSASTRMLDSVCILLFLTAVGILLPSA
ncbi:hypothetical protein GGI07_004017 [Coemansia sp. Benny D115]|nr:hypothetical protein GGI07_004017 [Coemansia sp. Benny D115]